MASLVALQDSDLILEHSGFIRTTEVFLGDAVALVKNSNNYKTECMAQ